MAKRGKGKPWDLLVMGVVLLGLALRVLWSPPAEHPVFGRVVVSAAMVVFAAIGMTAWFGWRSALSAADECLAGWQSCIDGLRELGGTPRSTPDDSPERDVT